MNVLPTSPRIIQEGNNPEVKILALGASLIQGFTRINNALEFSPFTNQLAQHIKTDYPSLEYIIDNQGKSGQRTDQVLERAKKLAENHSYTHVIILAGTNDVINLDVDLKQSVKNLKQIYDLFNKHGTKRWVLTLPFFGDESDHEILRERRLQYNEELKKVLPANDVMHFDAWNDTKLSQRELYCDGVHFSPLGYTVFGDYIYENIKSSLDSVVQSSRL